MSIFPFVLVVLFGLSMAQLQVGVPDEKEKTTALKGILGREQGDIGMVDLETQL